ncbi:MAG TPA: cache domain-containing protein [Blastocatellia bacterium]|nr:cache domain-containing protein [Blastocatellia bacterium]
MSQKLGALCAVAAAAPIVAVSVLVHYQVSSSWRDQVDQRLQSDARAAEAIYERRLSELVSAVQRLAEEVGEKAVVSSTRTEREGSSALARLQDMLPRAQNEMGLDFVLITDPSGRVIARNNDKPAAGETVMGPNDKNPIAERVIGESSQRRNSPAAACVVESGDRLTRMGLDLVAQVKRPDGTSVDGALMLEAGAPVIAGGKFVGVVLAGQMLNNLFKMRPGASHLQAPLVADIRQSLFRDSDPNSNSNSIEDGGAVIALGDTIISSSVPPSGSASEVALRGLRRDPASSLEILQDQGRAYSLAWRPIRSLEGGAIGAVGIAVPTEDLAGPIPPLDTALLVTGLIALVLAGAAGFVFGRALGTRLSWLADAANRMSLGELTTPVVDPTVPQPTRGLLNFLVRDEVTRLADQLEQLRDSFRGAIERMRKR